MNLADGHAWGTSTTKGAKNAFHIVLLVIITFATSILALESHLWDFPALYNFGDSNSDTGSISAVFGRLPPPYGVTFFGEPSGRYSDGRVVLDFLADKLGLPYLNSFLDSIGTSYDHGANFAANAATIELPDGRMIDKGINQISLQRQLSEFDQFKNRTIELYLKGKRDGLPRPEDFSKALYMLDIGQNDLYFKLTTFSLDQVLSSIPDLIHQTSLAIQNLYEHGARAFWIHNTGPIGCLPIYLDLFPPQPGDTDGIGCIKSYNAAAQEFNKQLYSMVSRLRLQLQNATLTYVDIYSAKYSLFKDARIIGFVDPHGYCCNHQNLRPKDAKKLNNASVYEHCCSNPSEYIIWDGTHYTEAANHWVASRISDGLISDPPHPFTAACQNVAVL